MLTTPSTVGQPPEGAAGPVPTDPVKESALCLAGRDPADARHSVFEVLHLLRVLQLQSWQPRLLRFLQHYDGLEFILDAGDPEPMVLCRQALFAQLLHLNGGDVDPQRVKREVANELSEAAFASFGAVFRLETPRTDLPAQVVWQPLAQSWLDFLSAEPAERDQYWLSIGRASRHAATPEEIRAYLLAS